MPIKNLDLATIADGAYSGEAKYGFNYQVEVAIKDHKLDRISIVKNYDSVCAKLAEGVIKKVLGAQSPNVDAVTGATTTSKCLMKAIENAIQQGRYNDESTYETDYSFTHGDSIALFNRL